MLRPSIVRFGLVLETDGPGLVWESVSMIGAFTKRLNGFDTDHIAGQVAHRSADLLVLNFGAMIGAIGGGWLADRFHIKYVLLGFYALAAVSITLLGYKVPTEVLFILVGLAGASTIGTQILTYAYVGQYYPMSVRSTGIGWASGVGRSGAILAPIVIGMLVGMKLPLEQNFMAIAVPAVIALISVALINTRRSATAH